MNTIIILIAFIGICLGQRGNEIQIMGTGQFDQCEGKDLANYTYTIAANLDAATCSVINYAELGPVYLTSCQHNGEKVVNILTRLFESEYPAGAYSQHEGLFLVTSGNLQGKYVFFNVINLMLSYLKKCSSVLGYSYISTKSAVLLIADKLDPNVLISPTGPYQPFKKTATTICQGTIIYV